MTTPGNDEPMEKEILGDAHLLYSSCVSEIGGFKQQQWNVTNYAMLVFGAVASVSKIVEPLSQVEFAVLLLSGTAVLVVAWVIVGQLSDAIRVRRERLTHVRKHRLTEEFRNSWRAGKTPEECPDVPTEKTDLHALFRGVHVAAFAVTVWLLVRGLCAA
jgi:hypothetical protein